MPLQNIIRAEFSKRKKSRLKYNTSCDFSEQRFYPTDGAAILARAFRVARIVSASLVRYSSRCTHLKIYRYIFPALTRALNVTRPQNVAKPRLRWGGPAELLPLRFVHRLSLYPKSGPRTSRSHSFFKYSLLRPYLSAFPIQLHPLKLQRTHLIDVLLSISESRKNGPDLVRKQRCERFS